MGTGVSVREMADRENTDRENTDRESMERESAPREISSEGTNMQTGALHRYVETTEAETIKGLLVREVTAGLWNTAGRYARMLTGSLADRRAC